MEKGGGANAPYGPPGYATALCVNTDKQLGTQIKPAIALLYSWNAVATDKEFGCATARPPSNGTCANI